MTPVLADLEFPPINDIVIWPPLFDGFNKIALINVIAVVATFLVYWLGARKRALVPRGIQMAAESIHDFVKDGIVMQSIGPDGMRYIPYITSLFMFILIGNLFEVIPVFQMPANARMANPAILAIITLIMFVAVGIKHQGPLRYWKESLFPPGVPKPLYLLVTPIEAFSTFLVRPFSLAVRLFANMLAGHILLVTFTVLTIALFEISLILVAMPFSFAMLVFLTAFEIMIGFLQAYIFAILAAVYIDGALNPEH